MIFWCNSFLNDPKFSCTTYIFFVSLVLLLFLRKAWGLCAKPSFQGLLASHLHFSPQLNLHCAFCTLKRDVCSVYFQLIASPLRDLQSRSASNNLLHCFCTKILNLQTQSSLPALSAHLLGQLTCRACTKLGI